MLYIYNEAAYIFSLSQPPKRNLAKRSRMTKCSIQLIKEKNLLAAQINTIFLPDQHVSLKQQLANVKNKIRLYLMALVSKEGRKRFQSQPVLVMLVRLFLAQNVMLTSK